MPQFKIRRKRKPVVEKVQPKEKIVEEKIDENEAYESSSDDKAVNEAMDELSLHNEPQYEQKHEKVHRNYRPQFQKRAEVAQERPRFVNKTPMRARESLRRNAIYKNSAQAVPQMHQTRRDGRPKMRFRSIFGPNGDQLDAQTKARILYHSCFS